MMMLNPGRRRGSLIAQGLLFALCLTNCGGPSDRPDRDEDGAARQSSRAASPDPSASATVERSPAPQASRAQLTHEYLAGRWCFSRLDGEGERGIYVFDADGSYRVGIAWTGSEYHLEERSDPEMFWQSYGGPVEVEPDRFVVLLSNSYEVEFKRAPC